MNLTIAQLVLDTHRVEVSGWDISQSFFVEKPELEWNEVNGKQITLRRVLRKDDAVRAAAAVDGAGPVLAGGLLGRAHCDDSAGIPPVPAKPGISTHLRLGKNTQIVGEDLDV
ncbi:MAG TPA: hypothetical protein VIW93_14360 [Candidatus Acidoferrum sp.]